MSSSFRIFMPQRQPLDKNLEDLLPSDLIDDLDFSYDENYEKTEEKNQKFEVYKFVQSNIEEDKEEDKNDENNKDTTKKTIQNFKVQIKDVIINAISLFDCTNRSTNSVIVRGGQYVQCGTIISQIVAKEAVESSHQIIGIDHGNKLRDYLDQQKTNAMKLAKIIVKKYNIKTEILDCESVCYRVRTLIRIKVTNARAENINQLINGIIRVFSTSVQIYE